MRGPRVSERLYTVALFKPLRLYLLLLFFSLYHVASLPLLRIRVVHRSRAPSFCGSAPLRLSDGRVIHDAGRRFLAYI